MKKFLCCLLALSLLVFALSGCGGSSNGVAYRNSSQNQNEQDQQQDQNQNDQQDNEDNNDDNQDDEQNDNNEDGQQDNQNENENENDNGSGDNNNENNNNETDDTETLPTGETYTATGSGQHALSTTGNESQTYSNVIIYKTGDASTASDNADFYGENAAVLASGGSILNLSDSYVSTDATYANAVFSYASTINVSNTTIKTYKRNSGGIMVTGGGTLNATNLTITTEGNSAAAIRSDRGGGTMTVTKGTYKTSGQGSPVIYCTADITVSDADLESTSAQGIVIEGKNSVTLNDCYLTANNVSKNSNNSDYYQAVMIYQSFSGDAAEGTGEFTMKGTSLTNKNGDIFFVNNTTAIINLTDSDITNNDSSGVFLRAAAAGWGTSGSNGGKVTLNASNQTINGNILVDSISSLSMTLSDNSTFSGAINPSGQTGTVNVTINSGSTWTLTGNSYVSSLTNNGTINKSGYTLYVNGTAQ